MERHFKEDIEPYLAKLRKIPFVEGARLEAREKVAGPHRWDAAIEIKVGGRAHRLFVELRRTPHLTVPLVNLFQDHLGEARAKWILFTPYVTPPMADRLEKAEINFVDLAGNCRVEVDKGHVAIIQGRRPLVKHVDEGALAPAGFRVLFALLARPEILRAPVREIAAEVGVGRNVVATTLRRLEYAGILGRTRARTVLMRPKEALDRWVAGYREVLRPRLMIGQYQPQETDPLKLEKQVETFFREAQPRAPDGREWRWAWGGTAAAYRLTDYFRGEETVLHLETPMPTLQRDLRMLPARTGNFTVLGVPAPVALAGAQPNTVHPLLVYAELLMINDDRAVETATEIFQRFLERLR
jgi:hypothetical protein